MRLDLHLHTHVSDGRVSPADAVRAAVQGGLDVIAVTDHDTAEGVIEARAAARDLPVRVVPGIEISARHEDGEIHVLGYWVDPFAESVLRHQISAADRRRERMRAMIGRLDTLGVGVSFDEVQEIAGDTVRSLGRPHLARALMAGGHVRSFGEAFGRFLRDGGPAYVMQDFPSVRSAIETIHAAGGVAVWAHPELEVFDAQIRRFAAWGLDGVECFRPLTPPPLSMLLDRAAGDLRLLRTGGSDWHGPHSGRLGGFYVGRANVAGFIGYEPAFFDGLDALAR